MPTSVQIRCETKKRRPRQLNQDKRTEVAKKKGHLYRIPYKKKENFLLNKIILF